MLAGLGSRTRTLQFGRNGGKFECEQCVNGRPLPRVTKFPMKKVDYVKYDNCFNDGQEGSQKLSFDRYNAMSKALNKTNRPMLYSMCNWGVDGPWLFVPNIANSWRVTGDLVDTFNRDGPQCPCVEKEGLDCKVPGFFCFMMNLVNKVVFYPSKAFPGAWNDMDLLHT